MDRLYHLIFTLLLLVPGFARAQQGAAKPTDKIEMESVTDTEFELTVAYPRELLFPEGEAVAGKARWFVSKDRQFKMAVWGERNISQITLASELERRLQWEQKKPELTITYKATKDNWFTYSATVGDSIIYAKTVFDRGTFKSLRLLYPSATKAALDPYVKQIIASFKPHEYRTYTGSVLFKAGEDISILRDDIGDPPSPNVFLASDVGDKPFIERAACVFEESERKRFDELQVSQIVTVAGFHHPTVVMHRPLKIDIHITTISRCVLKSVSDEKTAAPEPTAAVQPLNVEISYQTLKLGMTKEEAITELEKTCTKNSMLALVLTQETCPESQLPHTSVAQIGTVALHCFDKEDKKIESLALLFDEDNVRLMRIIIRIPYSNAAQQELDQYLTQKYGNRIPYSDGDAERFNTFLRTERIRGYDDRPIYALDKVFNSYADQKVLLVLSRASDGEVRMSIVYLHSDLAARMHREHSPKKLDF
jgi:hypothetical protein